MNNYILSCCSTADLKEEHLSKRNISYICFHFSLDGKQYKDDLGKSIPFKDFYNAMSNGAETKTSQINVDEFVEYFENIVKQGKDILHISLSSGLSGVFNSATIAKNIVLEKYPDRKILIVDSLGASSGYGLLVDKLADLKDDGMTLEELYKWAEDNKLRLHHWFFSTDLTFYIKGGRVSKTSGFVGGLLGICPLLHMDAAGKLIPKAKVRSKRRVIDEIVRRMTEYVDNGLDYNEKCFISNSNCLEDAESVAFLVKELFPKLKGDVLINDIGTTIGSHTGPGTVALFFWGTDRGKEQK